MQFVHLGIHTEFSITESIVRIPDLIKAAASDEMPALAITDLSNLHEQMEQFYPHIEKMLADIEFLDPKNPRLLPLRLRRLFGRIQLDKMEYHLLRGIFSRVQALNNGTWKKSKDEDQN